MTKQYSARRCRELVTAARARHKHVELAEALAERIPWPVPHDATCHICGEVFTTGREDAKYCSEDCRAEFRRRYWHSYKKS